MRSMKQTTVAEMDVVTEVLSLLNSFAPKSLETRTEAPMLQPKAKAMKISVIS